MDWTEQGFTNDCTEEDFTMDWTEQGFTNDCTEEYFTMDWTEQVFANEYTEEDFTMDLTEQVFTEPATDQPVTSATQSRDWAIMSCTFNFVSELYRLFNVHEYDTYSCS